MNHSLFYIPLIDLGNKINAFSKSGEINGASLKNSYSSQPTPAFVTNGERNPPATVTGDQSTSDVQQTEMTENPNIGRKVTLITKHFKDILIRSYPNFVQVIISPVTTGLRHTINPNVCDELIDVMKQLLPDDACRSILVTGIGQTFCQGKYLPTRLLLYAFY